MGYCKDMWIAKYESIPDTASEAVEKGVAIHVAIEEARTTLTELGFDPGEIQNQIDALLEDLV